MKNKAASRPLVVCLDLEGVLVPEIWIAVAKKTGLPELRLTTRDVPDYDVLMRRRISILSREKIKLSDIQRVISTLAPLPGAAAFLTKLRAQTQVLILSDTYYEFAMPLMKKLGYPSLFCNRLTTDKKGMIRSYILRQKDGKKKSVDALRGLGFRVHAAGDSYNDTSMLAAADRGVLFNPPANIVREFPRFKVARDYSTLFKALL